MKKLCCILCCIILCVILACAVFSSCSDKETTPTVAPVDPSNPIDLTEPSVPPQKEKDYEKGTYTLMIYMCGSNLETKTGAATKNITEMLSAKLPPDTKVIIQTGGANAWRKYDISSEHSSRYEVKNGSLVLIEQNPGINMGLDSTLSDFLLWGDEKYPAEHRSLILWNHGGGTMKGICYDERYHYDALTLPELKTAFSTAFAKSNRKYDFIGFDACLMANYDTACIVKDYADYMIASEEREPSSGWDYEVLLSNLGKEDFYTKVLNAYAKKQAKKTTYTLSAIKLSELSRANVIIDGIIEQINYDLSCVGAAITEGKEFGAKIFPHKSTNLFDLGLLAEAIGIEYDFSGFITKVNGNAHDTATGMSIYFPTEQQEQLAAYSEICTNQRYVDFLNEYFNRQPETPISFINRGYNADGYLAFTLSKPSYSYVQTVGYILHSYAGSEQTQKLYAVGSDNDISLSDGVYTVNFNGRWVYLNDMLLHCDVYEENSAHTTFSAPVLIDGELALLLFTYLGSTRQITVDGYLLFADTTSRVYEMTAGTEVRVIYKDPHSDDNPYYEEGSVVWGEDTVLSVRNLDAGRYQYIPYIVDIYGNVYYAGTATVYFDGTTSVIEDISAG